MALLQGSEDFDRIEIIAAGDERPAVDLQIPLLSLPKLLETDAETVPDECPYIEAPPPKAGQAPETGVLRPDRLKVGLCWSGKPSHRNDRNRSVELAEFTPLLDLPDTDYFSLQTGPAARQIDQLSIAGLVRDLGRGFEDFSDTARAIKELDLVVSVDTSVAHLAAAMARPVWVVLPYAPDWRWMLHRPDSPWYFSMTLFRQTSPGDWTEVIARVRHALCKRLETLM